MQSGDQPRFPPPPPWSPTGGGREPTVRSAEPPAPPIRPLNIIGIIMFGDILAGFLTSGIPALSAPLLFFMVVGFISLLTGMKTRDNRPAILAFRVLAIAGMGCFFVLFAGVVAFSWWWGAYGFVQGVRRCWRRVLVLGPRTWPSPCW